MQVKDEGFVDQEIVTGMRKHYWLLHMIIKS